MKLEALCQQSNDDVHGSYCNLRNVMEMQCYARTRSILVSWKAHLGIDLFDISLMLMI